MAAMDQAQLPLPSQFSSQFWATFAAVAVVAVTAVVAVVAATLCFIVCWKSAHVLPPSVGWRPLKSIAIAIAILIAIVVVVVSIAVALQQHALPLPLLLLLPFAFISLLAFSQEIRSVSCNVAPSSGQAVSHLAACLLTYCILKAWEPQCSSGRVERQAEREGQRGRKTYRALDRQTGRLGDRETDRPHRNRQKQRATFCCLKSSAIFS